MFDSNYKGVEPPENKIDIDHWEEIEKQMSISSA